MKFVLLVGLPGSGKTTWVANNLPSAAFLDDITVFCKTKNEIIAAITAAARDHNTIVISDYHFVKEKSRENAVDIIKLLYPEASIKFFAWENNPENCWSNIVARNDGRKISQGSILKMAKLYTYPKDVDVSKIISVPKY